MIAVLTGDIVKSTKLSGEEYQNTIQYLQNLLQDVQTRFDAVGQIYRGDAFQIQFYNPAQALECALMLKLSLQGSQLSNKPIHCTLSLAYGSYSKLDAEPNTSSGPVFVNSGRGIEKTPKGDISLWFEEETQQPGDLLLNQFLNHLLSRLTKGQAVLLNQYIQSHYAELKELARITETSTQNISNRLNAIGAQLVRDYIKTVNDRVKAMELS